MTDEISAVKEGVDRHLGVGATNTALVTSGVNRVYRLAAGERRLIVRLNELAELSRFQKESWCIERASPLGVPGPTVLAVGTHGPYAYMLESEVVGRRGTELGSDEQLSAWRTLGSYLRRIHNIPVAGFGEELSDITSGTEAQWRRYVDYNLDQLASGDPLLEMGVVTASEQARLRSVFQELERSALSFGLSHGDCSLWNTIVGESGLVTLLDWGEAHAHVVPHYDFGVIQRMSLRDDSPGLAALLEGYGLDRAGYAAVRPLIQSVALLVATDKVRWARERRPDRLPDKVTILRAALDGGS